MLRTATKITGFLMTLALGLSALLVYADNGNGGNLAGGPPAVSDDQSYSGQGDHEWGHGHRRMCGDHRICRFFHKLNLTDDQKKQLKDIWQKQREAGKTAFEQLKAIKGSLNSELLAPEPDMNKINGLQAQLKTLQARMADNRLNSTLEVKKILTAEQFGKYLEFQKHKFADRHHRKWGHCGEGWGHWRHCRHHHGYRGYQNDGF